MLGRHQSTQRKEMKLITALVVLVICCEMPVTEQSKTMFKRETERNSATDCIGTANMDAYVDSVLQNAKHQIPDPIPLHNVDKTVHLRDGEVRGLSSLYRSGNSYISCNKDSVAIQISLGLRDLKGHYRWKKKIAFIRLSGHIFIKVTNFQATIKISQNLSKPKPRLDSFEITRLSGIKIQITGLGPLSYLLSSLSTLVASIFRKKIADAAEGPIRNAIRSALKKVKPVLPKY
ncbi:uncharacterized protein LOC143236902 isoform X2 [Tachypleus tridentatus]|uniref:uncharacterized protein LOC143236902 isoform X2 n=1 Tax=Tachypleus tridentatus TaxID=6853 RepID=UPI003FD50D6B